MPDSFNLNFIISAPRSGSTWLAQALNQHPEIFATEQRLFGDFYELWPNNNGNLAPRMTFDAYARSVSVHYFHSQTSETRREFIDELIHHYAESMFRFASAKTGKSILVDKVTPYPGTTQKVIRKIKSFFPQAKIIQLIRDGRDVVTSGTFDWLLKDGQDHERYKLFVEQDPDICLQRFFDDSTLRKWARNWKQTVSPFEKEQPDLKIRFESMKHDLASELVAIFELLNAESSTDLAKNCEEKVTFEKLTGRSPGQMEPTQKQRQGAVGDWKKYFTQSDAELFHSIAGHEMINENYVQDEQWIMSCPEALQLSLATK